MEGHKFYTVDEALSPGHKNLFCLMTSNPLVFFLTVSVCNHGPNPKEQFTLTIEAVSVKEKKVLFAIRSKRRPDECVGKCFRIFWILWILVHFLLFDTS